MLDFYLTLDHYKTTLSICGEYI